MMTQFRKGTDALATYVGKEFGGVAGPMAAQAIRTRTEPVEDEPEAPEGKEAEPGSVGMIKWKVKYEDWRQKHNVWVEQTNPRLFNIV